MKAVRILLEVVLSICMTTVANSDWFNQTSGTTRNLESVSLCNGNENTGYVAGWSGTILKTTNGGTTWVTQNAITTRGLRSVYFVNVNTGYAVGGLGEILKTTAGGNPWVELNSSGQYNYLYCVRCSSDANTAYIVGDSGYILKTRNGGVSWTHQNSGITSALRSVHFPQYGRTGYAVGDGGVIMKTFNGGGTWSLLNPVTNENLHSVYFIDAGYGFVVGDNGTILMTMNGGGIWTFLSYGTRDLYSISFGNYGYAAGNGGTVLRGTGAGWGRQTSNTEFNLRSISFLNTNSNTGYAVGWGGTIIKTTDGGGPGVEEEESKGEIGVTKHSFRIFPNPMSTTTLLSLNAKTSEKAKVAIYDVAGNLVTSFEMPTNRPTSWDSRKLPAGVYFLRATTGEYTATEKVVIAR